MNLRRPKPPKERKSRIVCDNMKPLYTLLWAMIFLIAIVSTTFLFHQLLIAPELKYDDSRALEALEYDSSSGYK